MTISIAEYCARVRRLRLVLPDLESRYNDDEGLTLSWKQDGKHCALIGEPDIVEQLEVIALTKLTWDHYKARILENLARLAGQATDAEQKAHYHLLAAQLETVELAKR